MPPVFGDMPLFITYDAGHDIGIGLRWYDATQTIARRYTELHVVGMYGSPNEYT